MKIFRESDLNLNSATILHQNAGRIFIYMTRLADGRSLVVKKKIIFSLNEGTELLREAFDMATMNHPNIIKIHGALLGGLSGFEYILIIMDYFPDGDLQQEIKRRMQSRTFWREEELWKFFIDLIEGFAHMQEKSIAHRDISPKKILRQGCNLVISDLECVSKNNEKIDMIAGNPAYLSPSLRYMYQIINKGLSFDNFSHNAYKSDVFSLGLTFLFMASLQDIEELGITNENLYNQKLSTRIKALNYSDPIKMLISNMLAYNEIKRPEFIQLKQEIKIKTNLTPNLEIVKRNIIMPNSNNNFISPTVIRPIQPQIFKAVDSNFYKNDFEKLSFHARNFDMRGIISNRNKKYFKLRVFVPMIYANSKTVDLELYIAQRKIPRCLVCSQVVTNQENILTQCKCFIHYSCYKVSTQLRLDSNCITRAFFCQRCNNYDLVVTKSFYACIQCSSPTTYKEGLGTNICLECIYRNRRYDDYWIYYRVIKRISNEVFQQNFHFCCYCLEIPDIYVGKNHPYCFKCIFKYFGQEQFVCINGCCYYQLNAILQEEYQALQRIEMEEKVNSSNTILGYTKVENYSNSSEISSKAFTQGINRNDLNENQIYGRVASQTPFSYSSPDNDSQKYNIANPNQNSYTKNPLPRIASERKETSEVNPLNFPSIPTEYKNVKVKSYCNACQMSKNQDKTIFVCCKGPKCTICKSDIHPNKSCMDGCQFRLNIYCPICKNNIIMIESSSFISKCKKCGEICIVCLELCGEKKHHRNCDKLYNSYS